MTNMVRLRSIRKDLKALELTPISGELGMSTHERIHIMGIIESSIGRCETLLKKDSCKESLTG